ncbi:hypothetical protein OPT61_g8201 [Boeremia exigua]|uniref:Uncharacterized protein n=1 Tax=Boeremia exigua TaxID=749465 RepID=A0ACC2I037_9PLEO|nr:hypothetical protein OPT61_g8201 [Boeremia exigua]
MSNETGSSLPQEAEHLFASSPPLPTQYSLPSMEEDASKSDPAVPQGPPQTPDRPRLKRVNTDETERPASAQQDRDDLDDHVEAEQDLSDDDEADPAMQIANFDWDDLHQSSSAYGRTQGMSTRQTAHSEDADYVCAEQRGRVGGEEKPLYELWLPGLHQILTSVDISVVRAFESALNLLQQNTMFRG